MKNLILAAATCMALCSGCCCCNCGCKCDCGCANCGKECMEKPCCDKCKCKDHCNQ